MNVGPLEVAFSSFDSNEAKCRGGAILFGNIPCRSSGCSASLGGALALLSATFVGNLAARGGGAIHLISDSTLTVQDAVFLMNRALAGDHNGAVPGSADWGVQGGLWLPWGPLFTQFCGPRLTQLRPNFDPLHSFTLRTPGAVDGADFRGGGAISMEGGGITVRAHPRRLSALSVPILNRFSMTLLYGRAGRLIAKNGGFRPGQVKRASFARNQAVKNPGFPPLKVAQIAQAYL
jgi:predicted outer membrane repeat protein